MPDFGVTSAGFAKKSYSDIRASLEGAAKSAFGQAVDLSPTGPMGQLLGIFSDEFSQIWEAVEDAYQISPDSAAGNTLDEIASLTGISRLAAQPSKVTVRFTGAADTIIPEAAVVTVAGNPTARFQTARSSIIALTGYVDIVCYSVATGPILAPAGTLTVLEAPISGVTSVTNPLDAAPGRNRETDAELRIRRADLLQRPKTPTIEGIRAAMKLLPGVTEAIVQENKTTSADDYGRPPKSIEVFVEGGEVQAILDTLWQTKGAGIETVGTITGQVTDSQGLPQSLSFSRPVEVLIYIKVTVNTNTNYKEGPVFPADGAEQIKNSVVAWGRTLRIGQDVWTSSIYAAAASVPGVRSIAVALNSLPNPTQTDTINIGVSEIAMFDTSRVTVVLI